MLIINVGKNKRFMQLLFCTKVWTHAQCKAAVVMQGPSKKKYTFINVHSIAQTLHNFMYVLKMYI